jgi:hypothetical protein
VTARSVGAAGVVPVDDQDVAVVEVGLLRAAVV